MAEPLPTPPSLPGRGLLGWLGRQFGHISKALHTDVTPPPASLQRTVYREGRVEEAPHPTEPGVVLRRTVVDEVIVTPAAPTPENGSADV